MRWAVAFHPEQVQAMPDGRVRILVPPLPIPEHCLPAALGRGWIVIGTDTDVFAQPLVDVPAQSNPRRSLEGETES